MPMIKGKGVGPSTSTKERLMVALAEDHQQVCGTIFRKWRGEHWMDGTYHLIDLTAGDGLSEQASCGRRYSYDVQIFRSAMKEYPSNFMGVALEREQKNLESFIETLRLACHEKMVERPVLFDPVFEALELGTLRCEAGDHRTFDFVKALPMAAQKKYGLIVFDPNPSKENLESLRVIAALTRRHPKLDVLCYLSGTAFKRISTATDFPNVWEALQALNKQFWLMSELLGQNQYAVFLGLNFKPGDWLDPYCKIRRLGFVDVITEEGQARVKKLQYTNKQLEEMNGRTP